MIVRTAMVGLGSVGLTLLKIIRTKQDTLRRAYDIRFRIVCLSDSSGTAVNPGGFDIDDVIGAKSRAGGIKRLAGFNSGLAAWRALASLELDIVFEASPVDLQTGGPGLTVARTALSGGIPVVLANKGPVALALRELEQLARRSGAGLRYSATVCGGLPIINIARRDMIAADITKFQGIFNSTTNFILDMMGAGRSYDDALAEAQERGIAEADPSLDVEGWDTANKLVIIVNSILKRWVSLSDVRVTGITRVMAQEVLREKARQHAIKLVASFEDNNLTVQPKPVPADSFLGQCSGWEMGIEMHSDIYGIMYHKLWEREPIPTAAAMMRDAVDIVTAGG